jgi:hypothetical protein
MKQPIFFTGSAPLTGKHINISPKGLPSSSFSILGPNLCAYIDATGSGCETISHVHENGRVTIMFCSFDKAPQIMRLFCTARVVEFDEPDFGEWIKRMGEKRVTAMRAIIVLDVFKVGLFFFLGTFRYVLSFCIICILSPCLYNTLHQHPTHPPPRSKHHAATPSPISPQNQTQKTARNKSPTSTTATPWAIGAASRSTRGPSTPTARRITRIRWMDCPGCAGQGGIRVI